jgi:hypothetical protein
MMADTHDARSAAAELLQVLQHSSLLLLRIQARKCCLLPAAAPCGYKGWLPPCCLHPAILQLLLGPSPDACCCFCVPAA